MQSHQHSLEEEAKVIRRSYALSSIILRLDLFTPRAALKPCSVWLADEPRAESSQPITSVIARVA